MGFLDPKNTFGCIGCTVVGFIGGFVLLLVVLLALTIQELPFGQDAAWAWMFGALSADASSPWVPQPQDQPIVVGGGEWCVTLARQLSPEESHLNHGRVYGFVRDANGSPLAAVPMRVEWDGGFIDQVTDPNGRYEFILSPGKYDVRVNVLDSEKAYFRTNLRKYWGHYTYQVDFSQGSCQSGTEVVEQQIVIATTGYSSNPNAPSGLPVNGIITATFHDPSYFKQFGREHEGIDIAVPIGTPVATTMAGKVAWAGYKGAWGNVVAVENGPWLVISAHLSQIDVQSNQILTYGQIIGLSGSSGNSTGPHVHYEVRYNGVPVNKP